MIPIEEQLAILRRGTSEIISETDLAEKLKLGRPLRVKLGVDPTVASVTLGWAVVLRKLRDFQRLGHTAVLIIGDFTAQIGDPSGKSKTRPQLTREQVEANVAEVGKQVYKILDPDKTEIRYNADWLGKMGFAEVIGLCSRYTVARILERDDFTNRLKEERPIGMHEILYPLCQGYDSVAVEADVELGGNDQKFNNLVGRNLMGQFGQPAQVVLLCPLLVGTDGKEKMSQSLGNYVGVADSPDEMYGKTMSIPDELMANWFELCTDVPLDEVRNLIEAARNGSVNPRDVKRRLAIEIVSLYHPDAEPPDAVGRVHFAQGAASVSISAGAPGQVVGRAPDPTVVVTQNVTASGAAITAHERFRSQFTERQQPAEAEEAAIPSEAVSEGAVSLPTLLVLLDLAKSNGAAKDLIKAGAVSIEGEKVSDLRLPVEAVRGKVLKVGKHHFRKLV